MIKLVFGLALLFFIGWKISSAWSNEEFKAVDFSESGFVFLIGALLLMPLNWMFEVLKWKLLSDRFQPQSFWLSFQQVLAGVSTSLMTPNRVGNFIGRAIMMDKQHKPLSIIATIHSNLAQFTASISFGLIGLMFISFDETYISTTTIQSSAAIILVVGLTFYFFPNLLLVNPIAKLFSDDVKKGIKDAQAQSLLFKAAILLISLSRYLVFLSQFALLLFAFDVQMDFNDMIPAIAVVFLITTVIPSFLFGKLFVREASALFILSSFGVSTLVILATVFILWFINLAVPALIGAFILIRSK